MWWGVEIWVGLSIRSINITPRLHFSRFDPVRRRGWRYLILSAGGPRRCGSKFLWFTTPEVESLDIVRPPASFKRRTRCRARVVGSYTGCGSVVHWPVLVVVVIMYGDGTVSSLFLWSRHVQASSSSLSTKPSFDGRIRSTDLNLGSCSWLFCIPSQPSCLESARWLATSGPVSQSFLLRS